MEIKLGIKAKDTVSGFTGIVTEECRYLNGCVQFRVTPKIDPKKVNEMPDSQWFDKEQLEYIDDGVNIKPKAPRKTNGGNTRNAPNYTDGKRS